MLKKIPLINLKYNFWVILAAAILFSIMQLTSTDAITVPVKPSYSSIFYDSSLQQFNGAALIVSGELVIEKPTLLQKIVLPQSFMELNILLMIGFGIYAAIMLIVVKKISVSQPFESNLYTMFYGLGLLVLIYPLIYLIIQHTIAQKIIDTITHQQFRLAHSNALIYCLCINTGFVFIRLSKVFKQGKKIQEENNLTI